MADGWLLQLRYVDANNYLGVRWFWGLVYVVQCAYSERRRHPIPSEGAT